MFKKSGLEVCLLHRGGLGRENITELFASLFRCQRFSQSHRRNVRRASKPIGLTATELESQLELDNAADVLRRVFLGPRAVYRSRAINQRMYKFHFKTPDKLQQYHEQRYKDTTLNQEEELGTDAPKYYRLRGLPNIISMDLVRSQLRSCMAPEDFTLVMAAVMKHEMGPGILANPSLQLLLQKWLVDRLDPERVLEFLSLFITRLEAAGLKCETRLSWSALIAAAQCHCTTAIRRFLKKWCIQSDRVMHKDEFKELLVAIKAGLLNLGTDKTPNKDAMLEIMFGFSSPAFRGPYHLMQNMPPRRWDVLKIWVEILTELHAGARIWEAWKLIRTRDRDAWETWAKSVVADTNATDTQAWEIYPPRIFIHALFKTRKPERAWEVFKRGGRGIRERDKETWNLLFEHAGFLRGDMDADLRQQLEPRFIKKLTREIFNLERDLGLQWIPPADEDSEGFHKAVDVDEVLEILSGDESFKRNCLSNAAKPGYPNWKAKFSTTRARR